MKKLVFILLMLFTGVNANLPLVPIDTIYMPVITLRSDTLSTHELNSIKLEIDMLRESIKLLENNILIISISNRGVPIQQWDYFDRHMFKKMTNKYYRLNERFLNLNLIYTQGLFNKRY